MIEQHYHFVKGQPPKPVFLPPPCQCIFDEMRKIVREELGALLDPKPECRMNGHVSTSEFSSRSVK